MPRLPPAKGSRRGRLAGIEIREPDDLDAAVVRFDELPGAAPDD
jgi:hypothetical protein